MFNELSKNISKAGSHQIVAYRENGNAAKPYAVLALSNKKGEELPLVAGVNPKTKKGYNNIARLAQQHGLATKELVAFQKTEGKAMTTVVAATRALAKAIGEELTKTPHTMKVEPGVDQNGKPLKIGGEPVMRIIEIKAK